jgi:hypothetical protein
MKAKEQQERALAESPRQSSNLNQIPPQCKEQASEVLTHLSFPFTLRQKPPRQETTGSTIHALHSEHKEFQERR